MSTRDTLFSLVHSFGATTAESLKNYLAQSFHAEDIPVERPKSTKIDKWAGKFKPLLSDNERLSRFCNLLSQEHIDLDELRKLSFSGIPEELRGLVWKLLLGYLPADKSKQVETIRRKRNDYFSLIQSIYPNLIDGKPMKDNELWNQIHVDVIRTFPIGLEGFCEVEEVQGLLCRVLYVYSVKHQKGNYWQGLNEIPVPFLLAFTAFYTDCTLRQLSHLSDKSLKLAFASQSIEADVYWCVTAFVDRLQQNGDYVVEKFGVISQRAILSRFEFLCQLADKQLLNDLQTKGIDFIFFAFRWMICLLIRELPINVIMRLWDSYFTRPDDVISFHLYTALSFLLTFSEDVQSKEHFEETLLFVQRIPTDNWTELHAEYLIYCAEQIEEIDKFYQTFTKEASSQLLVGLVESASLSMYKDIRIASNKI